MSGPAGMLPKDELDRFLDECRDPSSASALPAEAFGEAVPFELVERLELGGAPDTCSTYRKRAGRFHAWCEARGVRPLPAHAGTVRLYLGWLAANEHRWSTINVSYAAIVAAHVALGHEAPDSAELNHAIRLLRTYLRRNPRPPISSVMLATVLEKCAGDPLACRDRAIFLTSHFGSLAPSRLAALDRENVVRRARSYVLKALPRGYEAPSLELVELWRHAEPKLCPVSALDAWLAERDALVRGRAISKDHGALFLGLRGGRGYPIVAGERLCARTVTRILKRRVWAAGLDPACVSVWGLHAATPANAARSRP